MNKWEKYLGIKFPECNMTGQCCRMASPSEPAIELLKRAAKGDSFARDFLCLFQPYESLEHAKEVNPELVERVLSVASRSKKYKSTTQVVFYKCRYLEGKNRCLVYEDRPLLCRTYPDTPFLAIAPGCAYEEWSKECKKKYKELRERLKELIKLQKMLLRAQGVYLPSKKTYYNELFIISPSYSWLR
ncbi:MAG: YkgJ family cysteine cluster protein [Cyanobacteriota bacterium]